MKFSTDALSGSYDERHDILYLYYKGKDHSYGSESPEGIVIMRSLDTDNVNGVIIYDFKDKVSRGDLDLNQFDLVFKAGVEEFQNGIDVP